jgi:hypothetical protein
MGLYYDESKTTNDNLGDAQLYNFNETAAINFIGIAFY